MVCTRIECRPKISIHEQNSNFHKPTGVKAIVPFAFIVAMGGVGFENITVAGFEEA